MKLEPLHPLQIERLRNMTHDEKWAIAKGMLRMAREVRRSAIRDLNPTWTAEEVERALAKEFASART
jgi:hypothetical protein